MATITGLPFSGRGPAIITIGDDTFPLSLVSELMLSQEKSHTSIMDWSGIPVANYEGATSYSCTVSAQDVPRSLVARLLGNAVTTATTTGRAKVVSAISLVNYADVVTALEATAISTTAASGTYIVEVPSATSTVTITNAAGAAVTVTDLFTSSPTITGTRTSASVYAVTVIAKTGAATTTITGGSTGERCAECAIQITSDTTQTGQNVVTTIERALLNGNEVKHGDETNMTELAFTCFQHPVTGRVYRQVAVE